MRATAWAQAAQSCAASANATHAAEDVLGLARALLYSARPAEAAQHATTLLSGPLKGDAQWVLGVVASQQHRPEDALAHFKEAANAHRETQNDAELSRDAHGAAGAHLALGQLDDALVAQRIATEAARRAGDRRMLGYTELALADILRTAGDGVGAEQALARALAGCDPTDLGWVKLKQGILYIDLDLPVLARAPLERALELEHGAPSARRDVVIAAELNLAWLARRTGQVSLDHVARAEAAGASALQVHLNRGLALADNGHAEEAATELAAAEAEEPTAQLVWWVTLHRGRVAEQLGRRDEAMAAYQRSAAAVVDLHKLAGRFGPMLLATHREPFLRLFGLFARAGQWREALEVLMQLDERTLATLSQPVSVSAGGTTPIEHTVAVTSPAVTMSVDTVLAAWGERHLVVVAPDGGQMWRLEINRGNVSGIAVGRVEELERLAALLEADPGNDEAARTLGTALLPVSTERQELLLVGPIARTPLAALRPRAPVSRVLGLVPRRAVAHGQGVALVIGNPRGDLPTGELEAREVARALKVTPLIGASARLDVVLAALAETRLLHAATHGALTSAGPILALADRPLTVNALRTLPRVPAIVVLASCSSASARDDSGWGSFAAVFLEAGATQVVASRWSVRDEVGLELMQAFYEHGGAADPVGALAAAQQTLSGRLTARDWAGFSVLLAPPEVP